MCIDQYSNKKPTKKYVFGYKVVKLVANKKCKPWYYDDMVFELGQTSPPLSKNISKCIDGEGYHLFVHKLDAINWRPFPSVEQSAILKCRLGEVVWEATDHKCKTLIVKSFIPLKQISKHSGRHIQNVNNN